MAASLVSSAYSDIAPIYGWPTLIEEVCSDIETSSGTTDVGSQGSNEGMRETGSVGNNSQEYRRATIRVYVTTRSTTRYTEDR